MIRRPRVLILFQFYVVEIFRISYGRISSAMINATDERGFAGWNWGALCIFKLSHISRNSWKLSKPNYWNAFETSQHI